jgi:hypothetical protein
VDFHHRAEPCDAIAIFLANINTKPFFDDAMRTPGLGIGLLVAFLVSFASYLFGLTTPEGTLSALFLLAGLWLLVYGAAFEQKDKLYLSGWGIVVAILSTFYFIPLQYTAGLVIVAIIGVVVLSLAWKPKTR